MSPTRSFLLGLFFLGALGVLGYYTLFLTNFTLFKAQPEIVVHFARTNGLREGDAVLVAGMRWGRIKSLSYDPAAPEERRVTVVASLNEPLELRVGAKLAIEDATLLGGRNLTIDPGPAGAPSIPASERLMGMVVANPLNSLGELVKESRADVEQIVDDIAFLTRQAREGKSPVGRLLSDPQMAEDLASSAQRAAATLANLEKLSGDLIAGRGTVGKLLTEDELYEKLRVSASKLAKLLEDASSVSGALAKGEGLAGRLAKDEQWAREFDEGLRSVSAVLKRLDRGEGTLGRLLQDDALLRDLESIVARVERGEGSLGKFLSRDDVYENVRETSENLAVITAQVRSGQGSLGRLMMDDEVYLQVKQALNIVQRALEEYREAAPITTFTSILFQTF
jgi:phospholipid/cholesterol/gamma-HCH transport system substrate-binding protein